MSYEFMKLSDVEVVETPTDTANVLIEENGIIKKAPKTAVGGAGGGSSIEIDMLISTTCRPDYGSTETTLAPENITILEGGIDNVVNAINEGRIPVVVVENLHIPDATYTYYASRQFASVYYYAGSFQFEYLYSYYTLMTIRMDDSGTVTGIESRSLM